MNNLTKEQIASFMEKQNNKGEARWFLDWQELGIINRDIS